MVYLRVRAGLRYTEVVVVVTPLSVGDGRWKVGVVDREGLLVVVVVVTPLTLSAGGRVITETNLTVDICLQTSMSVIITFDVGADGKPRVED